MIGSMGENISLVPENKHIPGVGQIKVQRKLFIRRYGFPRIQDPGNKIKNSRIKLLGDRLRGLNSRHASHAFMK